MDSSASGRASSRSTVNGFAIDVTQPGSTPYDRIIVFGGKRAKNNIIIDPSVNLAATIDGGHGIMNRLTGGGGETREHGWFGHTTLIGGPGPNQLIGLAGHVRFKPSRRPP